MAKARRKSTPIDERTVGELSEAELNEMLQRAMEEDFRNRPEYWAAARAEAAAQAEASERFRKTIGRAMAIEAGLVAPPWVDKLVNNSKSPAMPAPTDTKSSDTSAGASVRIIAEAKRMKAAGDIREGMSITDLSRLLATRVRGTSDEVDYRHIRNMARTWGLWPLSSIK